VRDGERTPLSLTVPRSGSSCGIAGTDEIEPIGLNQHNGPATPGSFRRAFEADAERRELAGAGVTARGRVAVTLLVRDQTSSVFRPSEVEQPGKSVQIGGARKFRSVGIAAGTGVIPILFTRLRSWVQVRQRPLLWCLRVSGTSETTERSFHLMGWYSLEGTRARCRKTVPSVSRIRTSRYGQIERSGWPQCAWVSPRH